MKPVDPPELTPPLVPGRVQVWLIEGGAPHDALRSILAGVLGVDGGGVAWEPDSMGRPRLVSPAGSGVDFNLSHSADVALVALALGRRVGVDVERVRPRSRWPGIAARWFSGAEQEEILDLPEPQRLRAFYDRWTKTEAWVKLTGEGLGRHGPPPAHAGIRGLLPCDGYAGAVAAEGGDWELDFWRLG